MQNSIASRQDFDIAVKLFGKAFKLSYEEVIKNFRLTQSRLRLEQPLTTTSTVLTFPILSNIQNQAQQFNTEQRLNMSDSMVPTRIGIFVAKPTSTTDTTFKLLSYFNPFVFTNATAMQTFYNSGQLSILVKNDTLLPNWPVAWHELAPQTQQTAAAGANSPVDQWDGDDYGMKTMQPFVLMIGGQNIQIKINMVTAPTAVDANSRIIVCMDGILAQNSTVTA